MISPLSVDYALAMTANGAHNNTLTQMLAVLDFAGYEMSDFIRTLNLLWRSFKNWIH
jgi:serine protease inhibitor